MNYVLIIGAGNLGTKLLTLLHKIKSVEIVGILDHDNNASGFKVADTLHIPTGDDLLNWQNEQVDIVIDTTGSKQELESVEGVFGDKIVMIPKSIAPKMSDWLQQEQQLLQQTINFSKQQALILNHIHEGVIGMDMDERITFINKRAQEILGLNKQQIVSKPIHQVIQQTRLPLVLRTRKIESDKEITLENGKTIITTRIPLIDDHNNLKGAIAVFRERDEIVTLAEQVSGLLEFEKMLTAIVNASEAAISVVDEQGKGLLINPAYTKLTGLTEEDVIGQPATRDIADEESIHQKVLQTRRSVQGGRMKLTSSHKEVYVNVAPILVDGKLKGSVAVLHDLSKIDSMTTELNKARQLVRHLESTYTFDDIIGNSNEMSLAIEQAKVAAKTKAPVLIRGESGTGKELFAYAIHHESDRRHRKFVKVDCSTLSKAKIETELFGFEGESSEQRNLSEQIGYFEQAAQGTIFLDEVDALPVSVQAKLLTVLQKQEIIRFGGEHPVPIDVRVITSTSKNLEKSIMQGTFLEEAYYYLNRLPLSIPPLRERGEDLNDLANLAIQKINQQFGRHVKSVDPGAFHYLKRYDWPKNVRELEHVLRAAMLYMDDDQEIITEEDLPVFIVEASKVSVEQHHDLPLNQSLQKSMEEYEKKVIQTVFEANHCNKTKTAEALGISIRNLYYKMDKYEI